MLSIACLHSIAKPCITCELTLVLILFHLGYNRVSTHACLTSLRFLILDLFTCKLFIYSYLRLHSHPASISNTYQSYCHYFLIIGSV